MHRISLIFAAVLLVAVPVHAQDWKQELLEDAVTVSGGKMVIEEYGLVKIELAGYESAQFQIKVHSEVPATGVMSRDNFVAMTAMMDATLLLTVFAEGYQVTASQFMQGYDYTELEQPIGTPDLEMNLFMTAEGMQIEFVNTGTGERSRNTMTWAEVYGK